MRVRNTLASLALSFSLFQAFPSANAVAQQPNAGGTAAPVQVGTRVGVVDIGYIFENHPTMTARIDAVNAEVKKAQEQIDARRQKLLKELELIKTLEENSPQYKQKEEEFATNESALKLEFVRKEKDFAELKAKIVYDSYKEVEGIVKYLAEQYQFGVVILSNNSRAEMDPKKPVTVQAGMNRDIVYVSPNLDLTEHVLLQLKQQNPTAAATKPPVQPGVANGAQAPAGNAPRSASGPRNTK